MKLLIVAIVLQTIGLQQSNGLQIPLFPTYGYAQKPDHSIYVLQSGFSDFNSSVNLAENIAMHGFLEADKLFSTQPSSALLMLQDAIIDSQIKFLESGVPVLLSMGKALRMSNYKAREGLVEACQQTQYTALKILEKMRNVRSSVVHGIKVDGDPSKQIIASMHQDLQNDFVDMYGDMRNTLQRAIQAVSDVRTSTTEEKAKIENDQAAAEDSDALAAISKMNKNAIASILNGSDASKVNMLRNSINNFIGGIAKIGAFSIETYAKFSKVANSDPEAARKLILKNTEAIHRKIQEIFTNICLEFGSVGDYLTAKEIGTAFVVVETGSDDVTYANNVAKKMTLDALSYEAKQRDVVVKLAVGIAKKGRKDFYRKVVEGAKVVFDALSN